MSGYDGPGQTGLMKFQSPVIDNQVYYGSFPPTPYDHHPLLQPGNPQEADFQYLAGSGYSSEKSFVHGSAPSVESRERKDRDLRVANAHHQRIPSSHSVQTLPRKRKASTESEYDLPAQKKAVLAQVHVQDPNGDYYDLSGQTSPYSPFVPTPTGSTGLPTCVSHGASPRPSGHHYSTSTASQVSLAAPSPHTPAFSPSFTTVKSEQSPAAPMTPIPRPTTSSPLKSSVPKLVRTSTMQQSPTAPCSTIAIGQTQTFNPYTLSTLKANLKLKGDLDSMKEDWTAEEKEARRRLVVFERDQSGSTITANFKGVAPQDRQASSICISCIWWKEKNEYYVTSVDTIYLLEALVGVRFTVEEKNRIRRNLEGFRPLTVSKARPDSEEFFKVIMGFPHPKPRNIEKDVKVFPWKILATALKKIISKYSASYSSTAAPLLTPASSIYSGEGLSEYQYPSSPHPEYMAAAGYPMNSEMGYMPQAVQMRVPRPVVTGPPELQLQMPEYVPAYDVNGQYIYQNGVPVTQATMGMPAHPMTAPVTRMPTWEYANFVNDSPVTLAPQSAPPTAYPRGPMVEAAEFMPHVHYQQH
ncbi:uncharacterized protein PV07_10607 [Cladophialophora immunda]|uniref:DUF7082 domain-containing protein n=1 Tax=Cladophialophora immunda TaxID=569365 RepID=A0A0D2CN08_9EURO|nr:uncharacterized protein PV07_10607 [Cladophialophora immunda]KIW24929.1 hypothetical protein PV07_10607 [Cladophialophora immunda]OQV02737.1 hypothetical protein CLAIMM_07882 [Cladophialophora immunda]